MQQTLALYSSGVAMTQYVQSVMFSGTEVLDVDVQIHFGSGLPGLVIVGMVDKAVSESKERVRAAISSIGLALPAKRIVINLAPANLYKEGSHFDLAIAVSILSQMGIIKTEYIIDTIIVGELSLDGRISGVKGVLPTALHAIDEAKKLICPFINAMEFATIADKLEFTCPRTLLELIDHLNQKSVCKKPNFTEENLQYKTKVYTDIADIKGQEKAKRALKIAASGGHNILLIGPPGTGKSMLVSSFAGLLPRLTSREILEVSVIYSVAGMLKTSSLGTNRPYRAPHHSASMVSIVGGGRSASPGEISLAHRGVLFLDELPEFDRHVLDALRQPLENGDITVARSEYRVTYPAKFQFVAAMNPCRCGYFGDVNRQCKRVPQCAIDYESKISGPIMDRIDIAIEVENESLSFMFNDKKELNEKSEGVQLRIEKIRNIQSDRYATDNLTNNSELNGHLIEKYCKIDKETQDIIEQYEKKFGLSARGYIRILRVARTIADIDGLEIINKNHVLEALRYRRVIPGTYMKRTQ